MLLLPKIPLAITLIAACTPSPRRSDASPAPPANIRLSCDTQPVDSAIFSFLVLNDSTLAPIRYALVYAMRLSRGADTDSLGRARLALAPQDSLTLGAHVLGYQPDPTITLRAPPGLRCTVVVVVRPLLLPVIQ
jgi:hypothetical protein